MNFHLNLSFFITITLKTLVAIYFHSIRTSPKLYGGRERDGIIAKDLH